VGKKTLTGTIAALIEKGLVRRRARAGSTGRPRTLQAASLRPEGKRALEVTHEKLHPTSTRILTLLSVATDPVPLVTIRNELGIRGGPFRRLQQKGYIALERVAVRQSPWDRLTPSGAGADSSASPTPTLTLTPAQRDALERITAAVREGEFKPVVLRGVTGSGKTEVYLRAARDTLERGRSVLFLVPEIALTPHLAGLLHARFEGQVAILHSALGQGERRDEWWRIRGGEARVVVGARAAVMSPIENLGLVVVDEEHESSYKQEDDPRYHARDVAIVRAKRSNGVVVLGSATPSLESYTHAVEGRYELCTIHERIGGRPMAAVELIDMKDVVREEGPETILSSPLREAMLERLEEGDQAMILLNRRGYSGQLLCRQCGFAMTCTECSVAMTLHRGGTLSVCHYCGLGRPTPERCVTCQGEYLRQVGYGTEKIETLVKETFEGVRVARMDRDTMRRKGSFESLLGRFARRELDVLVGTQMLAKGHDFPGVTLVGVLAADSGLGAPDFRAAERTFQLLTQVAGRAGRGERAGIVLIQTFDPSHYSLRFAREQDYQGFYEMERKFRRALQYPPLVGLINIVFEGETMAEAVSEARKVAGELKGLRLEGVKILGPAFAVRSKVAGRYRSQVLVKTLRRQHAHLRSVLRAMVGGATRSRTMSVDVDPVNLS
jgi:primosomal protein N' (replication factor Y)